MHTKHLFLLLMILALFTNCGQPTTKQANNTAAIPELLKRPRQIGPEGEMASMLELYDRMAGNIKANPKDVESKLTLIELFMQEARISGEHGYYYPAALKMADEVLAQPLEPALKYRALLDKASVLLSQHQFAEARRVGEEAVLINPNEAGIYGVLIDANVELGNYDKAVETADKMMSIRPDIRSYSRVSYLREIHGQVDPAIDAMKLAVSAGYPGVEPTEWARLTLGNLYLRYGKVDSAMYHYKMALSARPNYPFAVAALARAEAQKGNQAEADKLINQACELIPEVSFYVDKAIWEKKKGNTELAATLTQDIMGMLADDVESGHKMGLEYVEVYLELLNDPASALPYATEEYTARPDNIDVNHALARVYKAMGNQTKAQEHLQKAMRTNSKNPELLALAQ
jgi:tetratricopeptide (TPR) repeat protein